MTDHPNPKNNPPTIEATLASVPQSMEGDLQLRFVVNGARAKSGRQGEHGLLYFGTENEAAEYLHDLALHFGVNQQDITVRREKGLDQSEG